MEMNAHDAVGFPVYCHWGTCKAGDESCRWYGRISQASAYFLRIVNDGGVFRWYEDGKTYVDFDALLGPGGAWQALDGAD